MRLSLRFPASPAEEGAVFARLDRYSADLRSTRIAAVTSRIPHLAPHLKSADVNTGYDKLKCLVGQIGGINDRNSASSPKCWTQRAPMV